MDVGHISAEVNDPDPRRAIAGALRKARSAGATVTVNGALFDNLIKACGSLPAARDWLRVQVNTRQWPIVVGRRVSGGVAVELMTPRGWKPNRVNGWIAVHRREIQKPWPDIDIDDLGLSSQPDS